MGMYIAILTDADRGMPRWVTPIHVQGARIGIDASLAVAQLQLQQRLVRPGAVSGRTAIPCPATLEVKRTRRNRHHHPAHGGH